MKTQDYHSKFENYSNNTFENLKQKYFEIINGAREKNAARELFNNSILRPSFDENSKEISPLINSNEFNFKWENAYNLDNTKERPQIFNLLIEEIETPKRNEAVKKLGELDGLMKMNGFWFNDSSLVPSLAELSIDKLKLSFAQLFANISEEKRLEFLTQTQTSKLIDLLLFINYDYNELFSRNTKAQIFMIESKLEDRSLDEKIELIKAERDKTRSNIENDLVGNIYSHLNKTLSEFQATVIDFNTLKDLKGLIPEEYSFLTTLGDMPSFTLTPNTPPPTNFDFIKNLFEGFESIKDKSPFLANVVKSENPFRVLMAGMVFVYHEKLFIRYLNDKLDSLMNPIIELAETNAGINKDFTLARQNLVMHYLLKYAGLSPNTIDKTNIARLLHLLTGREGDKEIKNTRVYKFASNPFMSDKNLKQDLQFIRLYFENLGLQAIVDDINKEINSSI